MACTLLDCLSRKRDCRTLAAAALPMVQAMSLRLPRMASSPNTRVPWRGRWAHAWRLSPIALQRAHERSVDRPRGEHLAVGRGCLKPAGVDPRRLSVADVPHRGLAVARALERPGARQTLHLCLGDIVRHSLPGVCADRIVGESASTLGRGDDPIAGLRLVLHYDFLFA